MKGGRRGDPPRPSPGIYKRDLHFTHVFAGRDAPGKELARRGFACASFDMKRCPSENLMSVAGLVWVTLLCMRVMRRGIVHLGVECTSFCWLSRDTSGRSKDRLGDDSRQFVVTGNLMAFFMSWVGTLLVSRGVHYMYENPR